MKNNSLNLTFALSALVGVTEFLRNSGDDVVAEKLDIVVDQLKNVLNNLD